MVKSWFCHHTLFEYEYPCTEYEYECPEKQPMGLAVKLMDTIIPKTRLQEIPGHLLLSMLMNNPWPFLQAGSD